MAYIWPGPGLGSKIDLMAEELSANKKMWLILFLRLASLQVAIAAIMRPAISASKTSEFPPSLICWVLTPLSS